MAVTYNPPPNWPPPPVGWRPPRGWQAPPQWGPPPPGWPLWVEANPNPFLRSFAVVAVAEGVVFLVALLALGIPDAEGLGTLIGTGLAPGVTVGVFVGLIARSSARRWPLWLYVVAVIAGLVVVNLVAAYGRLSRGTA